MAANQRDIRNQKELNKEIANERSLEQDILELLRDRRGISSQTLSDQQDISNVIRDQTAQLKFQNEERRLLREITKGINKIATEAYSISKQELGTTKTNLNLTKQQEALDKSLLVLEQQREKFARSGAVLNSDIAISIAEQQVEAKKLKAELKKVAEDSEKIAGSFGKQSFSGLADIANAIPGLKKFASPFNEAAEAARAQAQENVDLHGSTKAITKAQAASNQQTNFGIDMYKDLRKGGMNMKDALDKAGVSAKQVKVGKLPTKATLSPLNAGFKALGPIIKKALGPISLIIAAIDVIKFFFKAMVAGSKATADMSRNMLISREAARELYKTSLPAAVGQFKEMSVAADGVSITLASFEKALASINNELGLQLNLTEDFGRETAMNVGEVAKMTENFGFSAKASKELFFEATKTGKPLEQINRELFGAVGSLASANGIVPDFAKLLDKAANIGGNLKANFGGSVSEVAKAVYQSKLLGLELSDMEGISSNLLDFQSSIENEMKAELLLGRNLNLEKAREAALMGDTETLMKQINKQVGSQKDFLKMNIIQRQALAEAVGMEVNQLADMFDKQAKMDALKKKNLETVNKLKAAGLNIDDKNFDIQTASLQEIRVAAEAAGKSEAQLREILGDQIYLRKQEEDATQKFNKALQQAKDVFVRLVDGGILDKFANALAGLTESALFSGFIAEGEAQDLVSSATTDEQRRIAEEALEAQSQATGTDDVVDTVGGVTSGAIIGAGIGSFVPGVGTAIGAGVGAIIGGVASMVKNYTDQTDADEALELARQSQADTATDFILRPGQRPLKFNRDDVVVGGTNLGGNNQKVEALLTSILAAVESGGDVFMDGNKVGKSLALSTSRMG